MLNFHNVFCMCDLSKFKPSQATLAANSTVLYKGNKCLGARISENNLSQLNLTR